MMMKPNSFPVRMDMTCANLAAQVMALAMEAQQLIALRLTRLAAGGPAAREEARMMVSEKITALHEAGEIARQAALGGKQDLGMANILQLYRKKIRANHRRLSLQDSHAL